jgi:hypothetical protein
MGKNRFSTWWSLWCKYNLHVFQSIILFQKALDTYDPPAVPDQKKSAYLDTAYMWHSSNLGDSNRRRAPPSMIGESKKYDIEIKKFIFLFFYRFEISI